MTTGNILLVEDHEDNRNIYRTILEHFGFAVTLAVGILASFFSAVYVTRTLFLIYINRRAPSQPISV